MPCEFFLLRYVPDVVKGEFVNIGVLLREAAGSPGRASTRSQAAWAEVRFTRDWSRVRCLDADADVALLEGLEGEIAARLRAVASARDPKAGPELLVASLEDSLSNSVQISEGRASLAENMTAELEQLMRMYVEPLRAPAARGRARTGRAALTALLRGEFERAGVWASMRKRIPAASYTRPGDPLRLDCGYRSLLPAAGAGAGVPEAGAEAGRATPDALIRIFQAVSLGGEVETAKVLAFSAPALREGMARVEGARLELTAVVEPLRAVVADDDEEASGEAGERYRFGVETLERHAIRVITANDLARAAETARRELGL